MGGKDVRDATRRILARLLSHGLAKGFNWLGRGSKKGFRDLHLKNIVLAAVRRSFCSASENVIENVIKNWFRFCNDRNGGRKGREQIKQKSAPKQQFAMDCDDSEYSDEV